MFKAQQLVRKQELKLVSKELIDEIPDDCILLKVMMAGICGSDIEYYNHGYCGSFKPVAPLVLGHEFSGVIEKIGKLVRKLSIGDTVVVDPSMPCGYCTYCISGNYNFCQNMKFFGSASCVPHIDGGFSEYVVVPEKNCLVINKKISWGLATLVEPLMVALSVVSKIDKLPYSSVAVFGGGTIGQLIIALLKFYGVKHCTLIDPRNEIFKFAEVSNIDMCLTPNNLEENMFDVCIESAGSSAALLACYKHTAKKGTIIQVGTINTEVNLPANLVMAKELTIKGCFRYAHQFEMALHLIESNKIKIDHIITHTVNLPDLEKGFQLLLDKTIITLKVQVQMEN